MKSKRRHPRKKKRTEAFVIEIYTDDTYTNKKNIYFYNDEPSEDSDDDSPEYNSKEEDCKNECSEYSDDDDSSDDDFINDCTPDSPNWIITGKNQYENLQQYTDVLLSYMSAEYALELKGKKHLKIQKRTELSFRKLMQKQRDKETCIIMEASIKVPENFLDKYSDGTYSSRHVNASDRVKINLGNKISKVGKVQSINNAENKVQVILELQTNEIKSMISSGIISKINYVKKMNGEDESCYDVTEEHYEFDVNRISFIPTPTLIKRRLKGIRSLMKNQSNSSSDLKKSVNSDCIKR